MEQGTLNVDAVVQAVRQLGASWAMSMKLCDITLSQTI